MRTSAPLDFSVLAARIQLGRGADGVAVNSPRTLFEGRKHSLFRFHAPISPSLMSEGPLSCALRAIHILIGWCCVCGSFVTYQAEEEDFLVGAKGRLRIKRAILGDFFGRSLRGDCRRSAELLDELSRTKSISIESLRTKIVSLKPHLGRNPEQG